MAKDRRFKQNVSILLNKKRSEILCRCPRYLMVKKTAESGGYLFERLEYNGPAVAIK